MSGTKGKGMGQSRTNLYCANKPQMQCIKLIAHVIDLTCESQIMVLRTTAESLKSL